jgi:ATP-dependent Lon protease
MSQARDESQEIVPERIGEDPVEVSVESGEGEPSAPVDVPEALAVLPLKNTVLFPTLLAPLLVNTPRSRRLIDHVLLTRERMFFTSAVRRELEGSPDADDIYRFGTVVRVVRMLKFPDGSYRLLVQGVSRARVEEFLPGLEGELPPGEKPFLRGRVAVAG